MKKFLPFLLCLLLCACAPVYRTTDELIAKARQEIPISDADSIHMEYAGMYEGEEKALAWFISGNEYQAHYYLPMELNIVGKGEYTFHHARKPIDRGRDIGVVYWQSGICLLINNPDCVEIMLGSESIPVGELPFLYYSVQVPREYKFLKADGTEIN